jgi:hypothetical protein
LAIETSFANAGLDLVVSRQPIIHGFVNNEIGRQVFQMTVRNVKKRHERKRREFFEIFMGDEKNDVRVVDVNKELQQIILAVQEPARVFTMKEFDIKAGKNITRTHKIQPFRRAYLVGMDQTHLFISALPRMVASVEMAHDVLKPLVVRHEKKPKRQGEWFFIKATAADESAIALEIDSMQKKGIISGTKNHAHVADEMIKIKDKTFVRGNITHPDHRKEILKTWYSVMRNTELRENGLNRIGWID